MKLTQPLKKIYYFDYNSTHIPFPDILEKNLAWYLENFFNPSGANRFSLKVQNEIEKARQFFVDLSTSGKDSTTFVSTGTEANYMLLNAIAKNNTLPDTVIVSPYEHSSVFSGCEKLNLKPIILKGNETGVIDLEELEENVKKTGSAIFITGAANETGVVQPASKIAAIAKLHNVPFYSDLMQAFGKTEINFSILDGFSIAGHKTGGGPGAALASIRSGQKIDNYALFAGGYQEGGRRAGTENTPAILSFADAAKIKLNELTETTQRLASYQQEIENFITGINGEIIARYSPRLTNTTFAILPVHSLDFLLIALEEKGIVISTGSSCKSRVREPSQSLLAMGYTQEKALRAVRISSGYFTTQSDVDYLLEHLKDAILKFK